MMNETIKQKWLNALRSDKYVQGVGKLRDLNNKFCCLGVLCDVVDSTGWEAKILNYSFDNCYHLLPSSMTKWLDIGVVHQEFLMEMNDLQKKSFKEIADWIEENL